jgi:4a-hydroxytetrahydrobiopterin dehydratase
MERLSDSEIDARLLALSGTSASARTWKRAGQAITRDFERLNFSAAIDFVNAVAALAEDANHHPDIALHDYNHIRVTLSTHSARGLTERDFALARAIDALS